MSLSGLDSPDVEKAYQTAQAEKAGWFILSYASRDSVEVHAQGIHGAHEMRDAALSYYRSSDTKPLFGLIQFRRRKVLIKLVLEGTTRLLLARVQVHWSAVTSRFAHDTTYEPNQCEQIDDNSLTRHIELHSSRSSSGSNKKPALDGIQETFEERTSLDKAKEKLAPAKTSESAEAQPKPPEGQNITAVEPVKPPKPEPKFSHSEPARPSIVETHLAPPREEETKSLLKPDYALSINAFSIPDDDSLSDDDLAPRLSSQTARPSPSEYYASSLYESLYKSKAKLGPRPSPDKRPGSSKSNRAIATLPMGMRTSRPVSTVQPRPKSRDSTLVGSVLPPPPPIPETPVTLEIPRPRSSAGSVKSLPATLPKSSGMTPEKARLKKYQQMYKRKEKERARQSAIPAVPALPPVTTQPESTMPKSNKTLVKQIEPESTLSPIDNTKSDSGVEMGESPTEDAPKAQPTVPRIPTSPITTFDKATTTNKPLDPTPISLENEVQQIPRSEEVSSAQSMSSPTSVPDSSARASTRPTSPSEVSMGEKEPTLTSEAVEEDQVNTPSTIVQETAHTTTTTAESAKAASSVLAASVDGTPPKHYSHISVQHLDVSSPYDESTSLQTAEPDSASTSRDDLVESYKAKRHGVVPPLTTNVSASNSEVEYDDDFIDELGDAEVVQAKSMSVSKSPITPFFSRRPSINLLADQDPPNSIEPWPSLNDKASTPRNLPDQPARTPSSTRPSPLPQQQDDKLVVAKPMKIQTGIASKIADLQRSFSRGSPSNTTPSPSNKTPEGAKNSISQRGFPFNKTTPSQSSSAQWSNRPASKASFSSVDTESPVRERPRAGSNLSSRISLYNNQPPEKPKKDIMEVRATIVRTDRTTNQSHGSSTAETRLELHESPIVINHQRAPSATANTQVQRDKHPLRKSSLAFPPLSPVSDKDFSTGSTSARRSMEGAWRSLSRRMSRSDASTKTSPTGTSPTAAISSQSLPPRNMSNTSLDTTDSRSDSQSQKRGGSRASRLIRRMSSSMTSLASVGVGRTGRSGTMGKDGGGFDSGVGTGVSPFSIAEVSEAVARPAAVDVGDMNVQFPDTLLWKRRWVEVDGEGFIVLKPIEQGGGGGGGMAKTAGKLNVKKYHLSEFREPFAPDLERQEMPDSVILDFRDGRTVQLSCGSVAEQRGVLRLLVDSWNGWKDIEV